MTTSGSAKRRGVFLRIELPSAELLLLWLGFGGIDVPANSLDVDGATYQGLGEVVGIPALEAALNGKSSRLDFTLSGVTSSIAALADSEAADIRGALVNVGACKFGEDWQIDGDVIWLYDCVADVLKTAMAAHADGGQTWVVTLSAGTANAGRSRAEYATWTDAQHQKSHPGDLFFNNVPPPEATKRWPGG